MAIILSTFYITRSKKPDQTSAEGCSDTTSAPTYAPGQTHIQCVLKTSDNAEQIASATANQNSQNQQL